MLLTDFWKLVGLKLEVDFEKRTYSITIGPLKLKGLAFTTIKALSATSAIPERILTEQFIQREVMWGDFRGEEIDDCIESLRGLQKISEERAVTFDKSGNPQDAIFASLLRSWANECDHSATLLSQALEEENDPINTGMDTSARDAIPAALGKLRTQTYPFVAMLIELLPDGNPVKAQATKKMEYGRDVLVRFFNVPGSAIHAPSLEIEYA
jgi:hypothetical protein